MPADETSPLLSTLSTSDHNSSRTYASHEQLEANGNGEVGLAKPTMNVAAIVSCERVYPVIVDYFCTFFQLRTVIAQFAGFGKKSGGIIFFPILIERIVI
jgi:hypothetical protein